MLKDKILEMMSLRDMTIQQLSVYSGLSIDTIKNLIYGRVTDPKLSTIIPLCKALNCSMDYILGHEHIALQQMRDFPSHSINLIQRIIDIESGLLSKGSKDHKAYRTVIIPNRFASDNMLYDSCVIGYIDVSDILPKYSHETITCGFLLQGDELAPFYFSDDILLINGERHPHSNEIGIWFCDQHMYIRRYHYNENGSGSLLPLQPNRGIMSMKNHNFQCFGTVISVFRGHLYYPSPYYHSGSGSNTKEQPDYDI